MAESDHADDFSSDAACVVLNEACDMAGIDCSSAELIRLGENAMYKVRGRDVVIRIGRNLDVLSDAAKEVATAAWLRSSGIAVTTPLEVWQPIVVRGRPVTFWHLIEDSGTAPSLADLASVLKRIHHLEVPKSLHLPNLDIFGRVSERLTAAASAVPRETVCFLRDHLSRLVKAHSSLSFDLPLCAIHGDAHDGNLIKTSDGASVLIDLERFAYGHPEADLSVTATEYLVGWHTAADYENFARTYGYDIMSWEGFPVLRAINELKMTTWLMQNVAENRRISDEFENRLASLRDDSIPRHWQPF